MLRQKWRARSSKKVDVCPLATDPVCLLATTPVCRQATNPAFLALFNDVEKTHCGQVLLDGSVFAGDEPSLVTKPHQHYHHTNTTPSLRLRYVIITLTPRHRCTNASQSPQPDYRINNPTARHPSSSAVQPPHQQHVIIAPTLRNHRKNPHAITVTTSRHQRDAAKRKPHPRNHCGNTTS